MTPKNSLPDSQETVKRGKFSQEPRSETPAEEDVMDTPFEVEYPIMDPNKKRTEHEEKLAENAQFQVSPFVAKGASKAGDLDQYYTVTPTKEWESMKKYNNFIIHGEVYKNDQTVFVRGMGLVKTGPPDPWKDHWIARILQVRARDAQHVYALVTWLYWSDELPIPATRSPDQVSKYGGRRKYHGNYELIASNYMQVLDVLTFAGKAEVYHWDEQDDNSGAQLYWRQTFCRETQELSKPRERCLCKGYFHPEISMYICDNPDCKLWLHPECLVDYVLNKTHRRLIMKEDPDAIDTNGVAGSNNQKVKGKPYKGHFSATIPVHSEDPPRISIKDLRSGAEPKTWTESICCPKCQTTIT